MDRRMANYGLRDRLPMSVCSQPPAKHRFGRQERIAHGQLPTVALCAPIGPFEPEVHIAIRTRTGCFFLKDPTSGPRCKGTRANQAVEYEVEPREARDVSHDALQITKSEILRCRAASQSPIPSKSCSDTDAHCGYGGSQIYSIKLFPDVEGATDVLLLGVRK